MATSSTTIAEINRLISSGTFKNATERAKNNYLSLVEGKNKGRISSIVSVPELYYTNAILVSINSKIENIASGIETDKKKKKTSKETVYSDRATVNILNKIYELQKASIGITTNANATGVAAIKHSEDFYKSVITTPIVNELSSIREGIRGVIFEIAKMNTAYSTVNTSYLKGDIFSTKDFLENAKKYALDKPLSAIRDAIEVYKFRLKDTIVRSIATTRALETAYVTGAIEDPGFIKRLERGLKNVGSLATFGLINKDDTLIRSGSIKRLLTFFFGEKFAKPSSRVEAGIQVKKAEWTTKDSTALTTVIPLWLSKIYSVLSGEARKEYDYRTGLLRNPDEVLSQEEEIASRKIKSLQEELRHLKENSRNSAQFLRRYNEINAEILEYYRRLNSGQLSVLRQEVQNIQSNIHTTNIEKSAELFSQMPEFSERAIQETVKSFTPFIEGLFRLRIKETFKKIINRGYSPLADENDTIGLEKVLTKGTAFQKIYTLFNKEALELDEKTANAIVHLSKFSSDTEFSARLRDTLDNLSERLSPEQLEKVSSIINNKELMKSIKKEAEREFKVKQEVGVYETGKTITTNGWLERIYSALLIGMAVSDAEVDSKTASIRAKQIAKHKEKEQKEKEKIERIRKEREEQIKAKIEEKKEKSNNAKLKRIIKKLDENVNASKKVSATLKKLDLKNSIFGALSSIGGTIKDVALGLGSMISGAIGNIGSSIAGALGAGYAGKKILDRFKPKGGFKGSINTDNLSKFGKGAGKFGLKALKAVPYLGTLLSAGIGAYNTNEDLGLKETSIFQKMGNALFSVPLSITDLFGITDSSSEKSFSNITKRLALGGNITKEQISYLTLEAANGSVIAKALLAGINDDKIREALNDKPINMNKVIKDNSNRFKDITNDLNTKLEKIITENNIDINDTTSRFMEVVYNKTKNLSPELRAAFIKAATKIEMTYSDSKSLLQKERQKLLSNIDRISTNYTQLASKLRNNTIDAVVNSKEKLTAYLEKQGVNIANSESINEYVKSIVENIEKAYSDKKNLSNDVVEILDKQLNEMNRILKDISTSNKDIAKTNKEIKENNSKYYLDKNSNSITMIITRNELDKLIGKEGVDLDLSKIKQYGNPRSGMYQISVDSNSNIPSLLGLKESKVKIPNNISNDTLMEASN
jgi:hypothetical protein